MKITKNNSEKYIWGDNCLGWHLVNSPKLSVIQESMPPKTQEALHLHHESQQFFFILKGVATFIIDEKEFVVEVNQGIHIQANQIHFIANHAQETLEFLVVSEPHAHGDRKNI